MKFKLLLFISIACLATASMAAVTIDFNAGIGGTPFSYTEGAVTFTSTGGGTLWAGTGPNGTMGLLTSDVPMAPIRADIAGGTSFVSVDIGDYNQDSDTLFLEIYAADDTMLDSVTLLIGEMDTSMHTLSLSASDIAYAIIGAREPAISGSSVYVDNFTYECEVIPAPGAALLGLIGVAGTSWLRRRRSL
jgi:MYXO-CTERM domain-containing protein